MIITNSDKGLGSYQRWHYILMPLPVGFIHYSFLCRFEEIQVFILVRIPRSRVGPTMGTGDGWDRRIRRIPCQEHDARGDHEPGGQGSDVALRCGQPPARVLPCQEESKTSTRILTGRRCRGPLANNPKDSHAATRVYMADLVTIQL